MTYLTPEQVSTKIGVNKITIYNRIKSNHINVKRKGRQYFILETDLPSIEQEIKKVHGRPPRIKDIQRTHELRQQGLSLLEISRAVLKREDKKTITRWLKLEVAKLEKEAVDNSVE